jgi:hypothetical protein
MILSQRRRRVVEPRCRPAPEPGVEAFAIGSLRLASRCVETIPGSACDRAFSGLEFFDPGTAKRDTTPPSRRAISRRAMSRDERKRCWSHERARRELRASLAAAAPRGPAERRAALNVVEIQTALLARTTSCSGVVRGVRAWRHMDHSPTVGQVSKVTLRVSKATFWRTQASNTPVLKGCGRRLERRGGWTFTLGTCRTVFPRFACLPRSMCTVTSVRGSLGSCQGERRPWLTLFMARRRPNPRAFTARNRFNPRAFTARNCFNPRARSWRAGAFRRARSASFQVQTRVLVPRLGRASYIGADGARPLLGGGGLDGPASGSQYPRRRSCPFTSTVSDRHERDEPMSPAREELGARRI